MPGRRQASRTGSIAALCLALLGGCVGDQTGSLATATNARPVVRASAVERPADAEHAKLVAAFGGEYRAPQLKALLSEVTTSLVPATERPDEAYQVTVLDSPVVNAFALPNGRLYVTRGLAALANDTAEIAAVLAHEIAHVTLRHAVARSELELRSALVSRVVADVLGDPSAGALVRDRSRFTIASFSRAQELEADQIGVRTLAKAGYDPYGASRFLTSLGRMSGAPAGGERNRANPDMLSTHPGTPERLALVLQAARRIGAPGLGDPGQARYLAAIDGMAFGDNPADGVARGRRFIHARLGIGFEGPEGISLENTPQAVLGTSRDGSRRLLFDAVETPPGQTLEGALQATWNEAIDPNSFETLAANGLPAVAATARGKDWVFRMAAIRSGATTFRLVYATHALDGEMERAFRQALESVRPVGAEEAQALQRLQLQVVTARAGDTVESLGQRMAMSDQPVERFLILNGLERGARIKPGEHYKLVVE